MGTTGTSTRRTILKRTLTAAAGAAAAPWVVGSSALGNAGTTRPNDRITLGLVGCGLHGVDWNLRQIFRYADAQVVAVCDVDAKRCEAAAKAVDDHYARALGRNTYRACTQYKDFRELIRRKDIDALVNCTPDHWHVIPSLMAVKAGKDVICEKPLTLTIAEGRALCDAVAGHDRIFQTASENRSIDTYIQLCEAVRNGRIGSLQRIIVSLPPGNETRGENFGDRQVQPVPEWFDYDTWLGQAPLAPYCPARCHGSYRWIRDYSGGRLSDWGAHLIDLAQWANNSENTGPVEVQGTGKFPPKTELFNTAEEFELRYRYTNGVELMVLSHGAAIRFEGTEGWIGFNGWRAPLEASKPSLLEPVSGDETLLYRPSEIVPRTEGMKGGEHRNFLDCVKSRKPCYAPAETGHRTASIAHIGNIAMQLGRPLRWDPKRERFDGDDEADAMLSRPQREPWAIANIDKWLQA